MQLNIGTLSIPLSGATKTFAILAKRGAGKSYAGAVLAEELYKNNIPFVVFDPIDVWWGLRLNKDGKSKGLPIVVFGLEHADITLEKDMGARIAQAVVKHNISCVINTFGISKKAQRQLITDFSEELLRINNTPRHIFIEEAHEFVPQRVFGEIGRTFNAVSNLVVMGRNRGLGVTLINQRAATINKDVLTQLDTLIALRNVAPQDRKALKEWVEHHAAEGDFETFMDSLPSLPTGEAWIWSPEFMGIFQKLKIRERETFHPDREKLGEQFEMPHLEQIDVQTFISEFGKENKARPGVKEAQSHEHQVGKFDSSERDLFINRINQLESQLIQKQQEVRQLENKMNQIAGILNNSNIATQVTTNKNTSLIDALPQYEKDIMSSIKEHPNIPFTRQQLSVKSGKSYTSSAYLAAIRKLIKLNLLKERNGDLYYEN